MLGIGTQLAAMRANLPLESHRMVRKAILVAYIAPIVLSTEAIVLSVSAEWMFPFHHALALVLYTMVLWIYLRGGLGTSMLMYVALWLMWSFDVLHATVYRIVVQAGVGLFASKHGIQLNLLAILGGLPFSYAFVRLWKSSRGSVVDEYI